MIQALLFILLLQGPQLGVPTGGRIPMPGGGIEYVLGAPGNSALGLSATFTLLGASFVEISNNSSRIKADLSAPDVQVQIWVNMSVAAVTGDIRIDCDTDAAFGSPTALGTLDNPAAGITEGAWTTVAAGECKTSGGVFLRAGMLNGNGAENPAITRLSLKVR